MGRRGMYEVEGAIAAVHGEDASPEDRDWPENAALYQEIIRMSPSPVVALNHAVAVAMSQGLEPGLKQIEKVGTSGELEQYHLYHAARADILRRLGRKAEAKHAYKEALRLATNKVEQEYLQRRLTQLHG